MSDIDGEARDEWKSRTSASAASNEPPYIIVRRRGAETEYDATGSACHWSRIADRAYRFASADEAAALADETQSRSRLWKYSVEKAKLASEGPRVRTPETMLCRCGMIVRPEEHFCHLDNDGPRAHFRPTALAIASEESPELRAFTVHSHYGAIGVDSRAEFDVLTAVLAEVALKERGQFPELFRGEENDERALRGIAAAAITALLRLKSGGAA